MLIESIFKGAITGLSGLGASKVFEKYIAKKIPVINKLFDNSEIPNEKLIDLIKITINEAFEIFNKKYNGKYLDLFKNEKNFNLIIESFNPGNKKLSIKQFHLDGYGYTEIEKEEAVKEFLLIFNKIVSNTTLLSIIAELKKFMDESRESNEILYYLKDEMERLSNLYKKFEQSKLNNKNDFNNNFGQIAISYGNSIINITQNIYVNKYNDVLPDNKGKYSNEWNKARNEILRYLNKGQSVNLVSQKGALWREITKDIKENHIKDMGIIDIAHPVNYSRKRFVKSMLDIKLKNCIVPDEPDDMVFMGEKFLEFDEPLIIVLNHFDVIKEKSYYNLEFYSALRTLVMDDRKLVLLINSYLPFCELIPKDNPCSDISLVNVELEKEKEKCL